MASQTTTVPAHGMRRELKIIDAAAFSIGLIGPVGAMALLGVGAAGLLGRGATWAFIFAAAGVSLVAYGFIKLSRHIAHTGSVYALVGLTLGPRAGFVAGWALLGAYVTIGAGSMIEIGLFFGKFLSGIGLIGSTDWIITALGALILVTVLCLARIGVITKVLLGTELAGAFLVTMLSVIIIIRLAAGHGPAGQTLNTGFLQLPHGTSVSVIASAAVFGFLAFAGFEGAAALGEETLSPKRQIPRAIKTAVVVVGAFYLLTIVGQSLGFGTSPRGVAAFQGAATPYADLATAYVGSALADLLNLVASISLFAITLGTINASARILYALARDAGAGPVTRLSQRGEPVGALAVTIAATLFIMVGQRLAGTTVLSATFYWLTIGTIALLVAYALATLGALRFLFFQGPRRAPAWQVVVPIAGVAFVGYTIYKNIVGVAAPYNVFPYLVAGWLAVGLALVAAVPGVASQVRGRLASSGERAAGPELATGQVR
jgi:amino acid transporter